MTSHEEQDTVRVIHLVEYMVGDGLFSTIPEVDRTFYRQAGVCSSKLWPTKLRGAILPRSTTKVSSSSAITPLVSNTRPDDNEQCENAELSKACNRTAPDTSQLFSPRPNLPVPFQRQTYRLWKSAMSMGFRFRTLRRRKAAVVLQPIGEFPLFVTDFALVRQGCETVGFFELLREFMSSFFVGTQVKLLPAVDLSCWQVASRINKTTGNLQLLAEDVNRALAGNCLPSDAFAVVGISWTDLYPSEKQHFVLGQAAADKRSATVSFGRFDTLSKLKDITQVDGELIWKMFKVVAHESCHLFYFDHCVFFDCLMNDSHSVSEAMHQPLHLCPICARKLHKVLRLRSIAQHHRSVLRFLKTLLLSSENARSPRLDEEHRWLIQCMKICEPQSSAEID